MLNRPSPHKRWFTIPQLLDRMLEAPKEAARLKGKDRKQRLQMVRRTVLKFVGQFGRQCT
jgi:hypothetical protein